MRKTKIVLALAFIFTAVTSSATTWDEPWADKVIREASSFVLAKIKSCDPDKGIAIQIIKTLGGKELKDSLVISDFYLLTICSSSGHDAEFRVAKTDSCYFFIKQNGKGNYCIATPTTGFSYVADGQVMATYRHSYHQASVPVVVYEKTMTAIFNNYHYIAYDKGYTDAFINEYLAKKPAGFSENEIDIFFLQHVALECVYHLRPGIKESLIFPFLNDLANFHNQVSAARALVACNTNETKQALLKVISDTAHRDFVKVMCIRTLGQFNSSEIKPRLIEIAGTASGKADDFGGNIMDPRVCTHIPTVKDALDELIAKL